MDVQQILDEAPISQYDVVDLYQWSTNFEAGTGPFTLFLDLIGWSQGNYGENFYELGDASLLGYVELDKLARALSQYALDPRDVERFVDALMEAETAE